MPLKTTQFNPHLPRQAFLLAEDNEAAEKALRQADLRCSGVDEEIAILSHWSIESVWVTVTPY